MNLKVYRYSSQDYSTNGMLMQIIDGKRDFMCYTLEDEFRTKKVMGETRIPSGIYSLSLRTVGGFHNKYLKRFSDIHKGMIQVDNVPNFEYILLHCGNTSESTSGCLLVGDSQINNMVNANGFIGSSAQAYRRIYPNIADAILKGEMVTIEYINID